MQDLLGRLNDIAVAQATLSRVLPALDEAERSRLRSYLASLTEERAQLLAQLPAAWARFDSRDVQGQLSDALLVLQD